MNIKSRIISMVAAGIALFGLSGTASATIELEMPDVLTGYTPDSGDAPWLTVRIENTAGGVNITFTTTISNPEFITDVWFKLSSGSDCSPGQAPAGQGPWQYCYQFDPNTKWDGPSRTIFVPGLSESSFVGLGGTGWSAVAHIQGIQPDCSGWIGAYNGSSTPVNYGSGSCSYEVPEPGSLGLLGFGLAGLGLAFRRRRKI